MECTAYNHFLSNADLKQKLKAAELIIKGYAQLFSLEGTASGKPHDDQEINKNMKGKYLLLLLTILNIYVNSRHQIGRYTDRCILHLQGLCEGCA
jgi:hypothetical protein